MMEEFNALVTKLTKAKDIDAKSEILQDMQKVYYRRLRNYLHLYMNLNILAQNLETMISVCRNKEPDPETDYPFVEKLLEENKKALFDMLKNELEFQSIIAKTYKNSLNLLNVLNDYKVDPPALRKSIHLFERDIWQTIKTMFSQLTTETIEKAKELPSLKVIDDTKLHIQRVPRDVIPFIRIKDVFEEFDRLKIYLAKNKVNTGRPISLTQGGGSVQEYLIEYKYNQAIVRLMHTVDQYCALNTIRFHLNLIKKVVAKRFYVIESNPANQEALVMEITHDNHDLALCYFRLQREILSVCESLKDECEIDVDYLKIIEAEIDYYCSFDVQILCGYEAEVGPQFNKEIEQRVHHTIELCSVLNGLFEKISAAINQILSKRETGIPKPQNSLLKKFLDQ